MRSGFIAYGGRKSVKNPKLLYERWVIFLDLMRAVYCDGLMADKARIPQQTIISNTKEKRKERRVTYLYMIYRYGHCPQK